LRILSIFDSTDPRSGGPIQAEVSRAEALAAHGATVHVVSCDAPLSDWLDQLPFAVTACGPARSGFGYCPSMSGKIEAQLADSDAVVVHGLWQYHGVAARKACLTHRRKYVVYPHGMLDPWFRCRYPLKHAKKQLFWWLAQYRVLRDAHAVLFTAEEERRVAQRQFLPYRIRERVVGFGTRDPGPCTCEEMGALAQAIPGLQGRPFILFLGRLHEKKRPQELVQAYLEMTELPFDLVLAGPGDDAIVSRIRAQVEQSDRADRVHLPGLLQGPAKWAAFRAAEAFILPSHQENFGIAVAEALACGTPVLISDKVNIWREIIADGAGYATPGTHEGTVALLRQWATTSPAQRDAMRQAARRCFLQRFEVDQSSLAYLGLLRECAER